MINDTRGRFPSAYAIIRSIKNRRIDVSTNGLFTHFARMPCEHLMIANSSVISMAHRLIEFTVELFGLNTRRPSQSTGVRRLH